ncbi:MAG: DDE-type integrase/transposase/recombinase [Methanosarcinales archaeon]|nr:DDE-type integrase/transposase/recombinase [Methanosarcinales archaeon]
MVTKINQLWAADITYIRLVQEFIYLAVIIDVFSRKCIGWKLGRDIDSELALEALNMALADRKDKGIFNLIHHSDREFNMPHGSMLTDLKKMVSRSA